MNPKYIWWLPDQPLRWFDKTTSPEVYRDISKYFNLQLHRGQYLNTLAIL